MLSYLHSFHAGNHADVIKHWLLLECAHYLQLKDKGFDYIDTHSGHGLYFIDSPQARKTGEIDAGVLKISAEAFPELQNYWSAVQADIRAGAYPGSALLLKRMLRQQDKAWLFELHPQALAALRQHCEEKRRCHVRQEDGLQAMLGLLPCNSARALVLIDPSYEVKGEYQSVVDTLVRAHSKMPQAMILLWYPVAQRADINTLEGRIKKSPLKNVQLFEVGVADDAEAGMSASGLIIVNPPWTLAQAFTRVAARLSQALSVDGESRWRHEVLLGERP